MGKKIPVKKAQEKILVNLQVEFICPKCGRSLAWALPQAAINCPQCGRWVTMANRKKIEGVELYLPLDSDQLVLFAEEAEA